MNSIFSMRHITRYVQNREKTKLLHISTWSSTKSTGTCMYRYIENTSKLVFCWTFVPNGLGHVQIPSPFNFIHNTMKRFQLLLRTGSNRLAQATPVSLMNFTQGTLTLLTKTPKHKHKTKNTTMCVPEQCNGPVCLTIRPQQQKGVFFFFKFQTLSSTHQLTIFKSKKCHKHNTWHRVLPKGLLFIASLLIVSIFKFIKQQTLEGHYIFTSLTLTHK